METSFIKGKPAHKLQDSQLWHAVRLPQIKSTSGWKKDNFGFTMLSSPFIRLASAYENYRSGKLLEVEVVDSEIDFLDFLCIVEDSESLRNIYLSQTRMLRPWLDVIDKVFLQDCGYEHFTHVTLCIFGREQTTTRYVFPPSIPNRYLGYYNNRDIVERLMNLCKEDFSFIESIC